jgi:hypothetical protein
MQWAEHISVPEKERIKMIASSSRSKFILFLFFTGRKVEPSPNLFNVTLSQKKTELIHHFDNRQISATTQAT